MKSFLFILLFLSTILGNAFSQSKILDKKVRIDIQDGTIGSVLNEIGTKGGFIFSYGQDIPHENSVSVKHSEQTVQQYLEEIFRHEIYCVEYGNKLIIRQKPIMPEVYAVRGRVVDAETKEPLTGVTIYIPGSDPLIGSISNTEGNFLINVPSGTDIIKISCIGFESSSIMPDQGAPRRIELYSSNQEIDELKIEYYTKPVNEVSNFPVSYIKGEALNKMPVSSIDNALQGNSPGIHVVRNSGMPGASLQVRIRGNHSLINSDPVYYLDGFPVQQTSLTAISPHDIESIEILKDASSTARYGATAGNGVILLNSRNGNRGKLAVSFDYYFGQQQAWNTLDLMNKEEFLEYFKVVRPTDSRFEKLDSLYDTDWMELIFHNATTEDSHLSFSGGNEKSDFYISTGYFRQSAIIKELDYKRYSFKVRSSHAIHSKLQISQDLTFAHVNLKGLKEGCFLNDFSNPILSSMCMLPLSPHTDSMPINISPEAKMANPQDDITLTRNSRKNYALMGNISATLDLAQNLSYDTRFGFEILYQDNISFNNAASVWSVNSENTIISSEYNILDLSFNWQNFIKFSKVFLKDHSVNALLGVNYGQCKNEWIPIMQSEYDSELKHVLDTSNASNRAWINLRQASDFMYQAGFASMHYAYNNRYHFNFMLRRDVVGYYYNNELSKTSEFYPSFSIGWIFWKKKSLFPDGILHYGKIRYGWGKAGNSPRINYSFYANMMRNLEYIYAFYSDREITNSASQRQTNKQFYIENMSAHNLGLDLGLFKNRLFITIDCFSNHLKKGDKRILNNPELLIRQLNHGQKFGIIPLPLAEVNNIGLEWNVNYKLNSNKLKWEANINFTHLKNKILDIESSYLSLINQNITDPISVNFPGEPAGSFYGYKIDYLFTEEDCQGEGSIVTEQPYTIDGAGRVMYAQPGAKAGDYKFVDINKDCVIDKKDKTIIGNPTPKFTYGILSSLLVLNFDLTMLIQGTYGNDIFNATKLWLYNPYGLSNWSRDILNSYMSPKYNVSGELISEGLTNTDLHRFDYYATNKNLRVSDFYVEDGSYIRLKNIQLGYTLKQEFTKRIHIRKFRIFIGALNLMTFTNYSGLDPEVGGWGIDSGIYPQPRTYLAGINLEF